MAREGDTARARRPPRRGCRSWKPGADVKGLSDEERSCLTRWIAGAPCAGGICPSDVMDGGTEAVALGLHRRGLLDEVPCSRDEGYWHSRPNALGRTALMADAAARGGMGLS